jgi:hypothetical protein
MREKIVAATLFILAVSMLASASSTDSQPITMSVGLPRDGYVHMSCAQTVNRFNANAQNRNLPVLVEDFSIQPGPGHMYRDKGIMIFIEEHQPTPAEPIPKLVSIDISAYLPHKQWKSKSRPGFKLDTFLQYVDCMIQTVEPQLTAQERTNLIGRMGLLRFSTPKEFPAYHLKFEHNYLEYLFNCKRTDEINDVTFGFEIRGSIEPPTNVEILPGHQR